MCRLDRSDHVRGVASSRMTRTATNTSQSGEMRLTGQMPTRGYTGGDGVVSPRRISSQIPYASTASNAGAPLPRRASITSSRTRVTSACSGTAAIGGRHVARATAPRQHARKAASATLGVPSMHECKSMILTDLRGASHTHAVVRADGASVPPMGHRNLSGGGGPATVSPVLFVRRQVLNFHLSMVGGA